MAKHGIKVDGSDTGEALMYRLYKYPLSESTNEKRKNHISCIRWIRSATLIFIMVSIIAGWTLGFRIRYVSSDSMAHTIDRFSFELSKPVSDAINIGDSVIYEDQQTVPGAFVMHRVKSFSTDGAVYYYERWRECYLG